MEEEEQNHLSFEELHTKLMKKYSKNKYNMNVENEKKFHNDISLIFNYNYEDEKKNHIYKSELYTEISLLLIDDFILYIINKVNEYISKKNEINNFEIKNRNDDDLFQNFMEQLEDIKNSEDEKVIDWLHQELFNQHKVIEATLLIDCIDKFLRLEKIISNAKKDISNLNLEKDEEYFIELIQYFYEFYDKLSKNNIIKDSNRLIKTIIRNINEEDNKFEVLNDDEVKIQQKFNYNTGDNLKVTQTETIEVEKNKEFKHEREIKLKEKKFDLLEER